MKTKLHTPVKPSRGLLGRPRLLEGLDRGVDARLTLVSAPAGFGKTTLLAAWLGERPAADRRVAWLSLDPADNEPVSFWTYVVSAFDGVLTGVGSSALDLLSTAPTPISAALTALLNELSSSPSDVWLVLDDYHLIVNPEIHQGMAFLLEHLPAQVHVVLLTRADPDLPLARWRARGELVEVRAAQLQFTADEVGAYLSGVPGVVLDAADVAVLGERTEGWIAALQLAALSLQGRTDASAFVAQFAGDDRYVVDYLVDEVLQHQPDQLRDFLLQTAVLDRLCGSLCDAVTGRADSADLLVGLERANMFTVALDDRREWYRYHHLFADVLQARHLSDRPDERAILHQRAGRWYESRDLTGPAIDHALAGQDEDRASHLMELALPEIRRQRQDATMHRWLRALPDDTVRQSPVLSVFYGSMQLESGDARSAETWLDHADRMLGSAPAEQEDRWSDSEELRRLPATIAIYRASLAQARGDVEGTTEHARRALARAGPADHLVRGGAAGFLGLAAWTRGDVATALESLAEAIAGLTAAGTHVDELTTTVLLADLWLVAGRPETARRLCAQALQRAEPWGPAVAPAAAELHVALSELDREIGDHASAEQHLDAARALDHRTGTTARTPRWFVARGLLAFADGDLQGAVVALDQAEQAYRSGVVPDTRPVAALRARIWIAQGALSAAVGWAADRGVDASDDVSYAAEFDHLTLVRLLLAQHRDHPTRGAADQALDLLGRLQDAAETAARAGSLLEIGLLQALAHDSVGRRSEAVETMARALARVQEPAGYARLFLNEGAPMLALLRELQQRGVAHPHPGRLLTIATDRTGADPADQGLPSAPLLSERELQVLRLLDSELSVPQIARELFISPNTLRTHTKHIFTKLDVTSRRSALINARDRGLL